MWDCVDEVEVVDDEEEERARDACERAECSVPMLITSI